MSFTEKRHWDCKAFVEGALKSKEIVGENGKVIKAFAVGKTKTFFRAGALEFLEAGRMTGLDSLATIIQRAARGWLSRSAGRYNSHLRKMEEATREWLPRSLCSRCRMRSSQVSKTEKSAKRESATKAPGKISKR